MALQVGIVGLPNVGKSTLFNALSDAGAESANYPFCTIEPNVGVVPVPDPRQDALVKVIKPKSVVPTAMEFVDIAGLVAGASKGEGLGNQFLSNIRECDAVLNVVRCFEDDNVVHVSGKVSPLDDIEVILTELVLRDIQSVETRLDRARKYAKSSGDDPVEVSVRAEEGGAVLEVSDRGPGVPRAERGRLFDAFYRSGDEERRSAKGIGLGLHLAALHANAMGAALDVLDRPGGGAIFSVRFRSA